MNNFLHDNLFAIIIFLLLIILLLIALIGLVLIKLLYKPKEENQAVKIEKKEPELPIVVATKQPKRITEESVIEKYFCENHLDSPSAGACLICEDVFCEKCLIEHDSLYFCKEHFRVFANNKWKQITDVKTTPDTPEDGLFIYNFKRFVWREKQIPSFVLTHYKINIDEDYIESYIQLNVIESEAENLKDEIENYKARL